MECRSIGNSKLQITNIKQITMAEIQHSKPAEQTSFGHWKLEFICNLMLVICYFKILQKE